jgi:hypothetical protein
MEIFTLPTLCRRVFSHSPQPHFTPYFLEVDTSFGSSIRFGGIECFVQSKGTIRDLRKIPENPCRKE